MEITTYQIHNVLRAYGKQLSLNVRGGRHKSITATNRDDSVTISTEARRKAVIDKVTADIVEKVARYGPKNGMEQEVLNQLEDEYGNKLTFKQDDTELVFKVIDEENGEVTKTLSTDDSKFLQYRFKEITKSKVDANMLG